MSHYQSGGNLPEHWTRTNIRSIAAATPNATVGGPFGSDLGSRDYVHTGTPVIRGQNMAGRWIAGEFVFVSEAKAKSLTSNLAEPGDIIFTQRGTLGQVSVVAENLFEKYLISQSQMKVTPDRSLADATFLYYLFSGEDQQEYIRQNTIKTGVPHINLGILRGIPMNLPPLPEQHAIAAALSDVDDLIDALNKLIAKKRNIKHAAMQQLLTGKTRLPGFDGTWDQKRIGEFTDCTSGGTPNTEISKYWNGSIRWMSSGELHQGRVKEVSGRITAAGLVSSSTKMIPVDCVLIGLAGQGKTRGTVAINLVPLCTNQSIAAVLPGSSFSSDYLYYNLQSRYDELRELSTGDGGRGGLNLTIIRNIKIPIPSKQEQESIAQVLSDMDAEIDTLEARVAKTRDIKQGMMQQLLTGRIRLLPPAAQET